MSNKQLISQEEQIELISNKIPNIVTHEYPVDRWICGSITSDGEINYLQ